MGYIVDRIEVSHVTRIEVIGNTKKVVLDGEALIYSTRILYDDDMNVLPRSLKLTDLGLQVRTIVGDEINEDCI